MAAKRGAVSELNDRNWDDEEEPEEAGLFTQASDDVMEQRVIKKAKRKGAGDEGSGTKMTAFAGFAGLTKSSQQKKVFSSKPAFSGASSLNGGEDRKRKAAEGNESSSYLHALKCLNEGVLAWVKQHVEENPYIILSPIFQDYEKYLDKLESKRSSPISCVTAKKDETKSDEGASSVPQSTFTPLSKDNAAKPADSDNGKDSEVTTSSKPLTFGTSTTESQSKGFTFGASTEPQSKGFAFGSSTTESQSKGFTFGSSTSEPQSKGFTFGSTAAPLNGGFKFSTGSTSGFSFGSKAESTATTTESSEKPKFSFGLTSSSGGSGFSFGTSATTSAQGPSSGAKKDDEEEYVPPKPEVKEVKEDGALYSKRCKLYYQKDNQWMDRGVGNVHLKALGDGEKKTQIIVRADTSIGNILLNVMMSSSMPISRQGKNNVFLVCVPNPPISSKPDPENDSKPVPMLIRVKTAEDADELFGKMEDRKQLL